MTPLSGPHLSINYVSGLDFSLSGVEVQEPEVSSSEYRFEIKCRVKHPTGHFDYFAQDLWLEPDSFVRFAEDLHKIQRGSADSAVLRNAGDMFAFRLDRAGRQLRWGLTIKEYMPPQDSANFSVAAGDADCDLLVNKLVKSLAIS